MFARSVLGHVGAVNGSVVEQFVGIALLAQPGKVLLAIVLVVVNALKAGQHVVVGQRRAPAVALGQDSRIDAVVVIANQSRIIARVAQRMAPVFLGVAQRRHIINCPRRAQVAAGVDAHPAGPTGGRLVKAVRKAHPLGGEAIEIRGFHPLVAGRAQTVGAKLIG